MAYTIPTTRTTGDLITASIWNTDIVDNIIFLKAQSASGIKLIQAIPPGSSAAQLSVITGAATPAEKVTVWDFDADADEFMDFKCFADVYNSGGITLKLPWAATSATSGNVVWGGAIRAIPDDAEDLDTTAHSYDFNEVTDAAPSAVGEIVYPSITFTDGADIDSLAAGQAFILRIRRNADDAADTMTGDARLYAPIIGETPA